MAKFCGKCGTRLEEELGLCPNCDQKEIDRIKSIPSFCVVCGSPMDKQTGTCPNCSKEATVEAPNQQPPSVWEPEVVWQPEPVEQYETVQQSAPVQQYQSEQQYEPIVESAPRHKKNRNSALETVITVLLSIALFLTSFAAVTIFSVRQTATEESINEILDHVDWSDLMEELYAFDTVTQQTVTIDTYVCNYLQAYANISVTERQLESFLEESDIGSFLAEKIAMYANNIFSDDERFRLTQREIVSLLEDDYDVMYEELGVFISTDVLEQLVASFVNGDFLEQVSVDTLKEEIPELYYVLNIGLSYITLTILIVLGLLFIFIMCRNNLSQALCGVGVIFVVLGALFSIPTIIAAWLPDVWENIFGGSVIGAIVGQALSLHLLFFGILLVVGILVLVGRSIVRKRIG